MARLPRKNLKVFAASATNNGQFGSGQVGTKVITNDIEQIQLLSAWANGWLSATIGARKFPPVEEFQSVQYVMGYQLAYLFQEGIPEYDPATPYFIKSIVRKTGTYELYGSLIDNNTGNALPAGVSDANWQFLQNLTNAVAPATETVAGIAEIATQAEVDSGTLDDKIVTPLKLKASRFQTADMKMTFNPTLQTGWVWANGLTIGSAASGATGRANDDTLALYTALWNASNNSTLVIQTSAGAPTTRGSDAATDFAANKRLPVPDMRGRVPAGKDDMGGAAPAGRLSGQPGGVNGLTLFAAGGVELHQLTIAEMAAHRHLLVNNVSNGATIIGNANTGLFINPNRGINIDESYQLSGTVNEPDRGPSGLSGTDTPHNNVQPTLICNYVIKL